MDKDNENPTTTPEEPKDETNTTDDTAPNESTAADDSSEEAAVEPKPETTEPEPVAEPSGEADKPAEADGGNTTGSTAADGADQTEAEAQPVSDTPPPVTLDDKAPASEAQTAPGTFSGAIKEGQPKNLKWLLMALGLVVVAILGYFAYSLLGSDDEPTETAVVKNEIAALRVSVPDGPLNQFYEAVTNDGSTFVNFQIYEGLVTYDKINRIVPMLATSWTNPDDETWRFTLKDGVTFHNGQPMTAEDVKYSLEQRDTVGKGGLAASISSVEVIDENTIEIKTDGPDPLLLSDLALIFIVDEPAEAAADAVASGTGPYVLAGGSEPAIDRVDLTAFDNYHGGQVYTRALSVRQLSDEDATAAFNDGEIDIAAGLVSSLDAVNVPAEQTVITNDFTVAFLATYAVDGRPLANADVREAIMKAVDPNKVIMAQSVNGHTESQFVTQDIPGYNPEISRPALNLEDARQHLRDAGYEDGLELELSYASANNRGMFESIRDQLAEIGITVKEDFYGDDADSFFGKIFSGDLDMAFFAYTPDILDASDVYATLFAAESGVIVNPVADQVKALLDQAAATLDENTRLGLLQQVGTLISDNTASVPLYSRDAVTVMNQVYAVERDLPTGSPGIKFFKVYLP